MAQYYDNAPIGDTCPTIDNIIGKMDNAKDAAEYIVEHPEEDSTEEARDIIAELVIAISDMEKIRSDNQELRKWRNDEYNRAEDAEGERDDAIKICKRLTD